MTLAEEVREKALQLKQDFDDVKAAGYTEGYEAGANAGGGGEGYDKGFEDGKQAEWDAFWEGFQAKGERGSYYYAFADRAWNDKIYNPKYPLNANHTNGIAYAFWYSSNITNTKVPIRAKNNCQMAFYCCYGLKTIPKIIWDNPTKIDRMFYDCLSLETLNCEGELALSGLDLSACTKLSHDSLMSVINCLAQTTTAKTLTLGTTNLAKLTNEEKAIATEKGWTLT